MSKSPLPQEPEHRSTVGTLAIRLPSHILDAIKEQASRDSNGLSATARRLLSLGLRVDDRRNGGEAA